MGKSSPTSVAACGIAGLDDILRGGLPRDCLFLLTGTPGTGRPRSPCNFSSKG
jgi:circadian clock protein KaiC